MAIIKNKNVNILKIIYGKDIIEKELALEDNKSRTIIECMKIAKN